MRVFLTRVANYIIEAKLQLPNKLDTSIKIYRQMLDEARQKNVFTTTRNNIATREKSGNHSWNWIFALLWRRIAEQTRRKKTRRKRSAILGCDNPARRFPSLRRDGFVLPPLLKRTHVRRYLRSIYLSNRMENTCFTSASGLITGVAIGFEAICRHRYLTKLNCQKNVIDVF